MPDENELRELIMHLALENASKFKGKTSPGIVVGHLIARMPELKQRSNEILPLAVDVCNQVNSMSIDEITTRLSQLGEVPRAVIAKKEVSSKLELPPNPEIAGHVLRFAPNPDGPLTLGNARPALLCDYFSKKYSGKFILRFEDTSPSVKPPLPEAYNWVLEDLDWLDIKIDEIYHQSDRLDIYYAVVEKLFSIGGAYVCTCPPGTFREFVRQSKPCPQRDLSPGENLRLWKKMLNGRFKQGEAVVRVKTDLSHANPAVRDWPALRIDEAPHPRVGSRYRVWPLYNWACAVDDHEMGVTHVIRAKEHLTNEVRQSFVYKYLGWSRPVTVTIGRVKLEGSVLSKSKIMAGLKSGSYTGIDDPRLGTIKAVRRRGISPKVIRDAILDLGIKPIEATLKWDNLYSANRALIDRVTPRLFFVESPALLRVRNVASSLRSVTLPNHPDNEELGRRIVPLEVKEGTVDLNIASSDLSSIREGEEIRLMGLFNVKVKAVRQEITESELSGISPEVAGRTGMKLIQWVPVSFGVQTEIQMLDATMTRGVSEKNVLLHKAGEMLQYMRFGFVRIEKISEEVTAIFCHR